MASVALEGVSKVFPGGVVAVDRVSFGVADREFVVLVGPSGCGKSTTLRLIAGLEEVTQGEIRIGKRVVNNVAPKNRDIAMVFQNYALYPHMSVYGNMAFGLKLRFGGGLLARCVRRLFRPRLAAELAAQRSTIEGRVKETARMLGIEPLLDRYPGQLSGGERQRVALGRAIVREPAAFLFDEPLSNLDAKLRGDMRRELRSLHRRLGATMIYVTHDQVEAMTLGDRIVVMDDGRVQQVGPPMEVYGKPKNRFVAGFLGAPSMNFLAGRFSAAADGIAFVTGGARLTWSAAELEDADDWRSLFDRDVELGVRPEDVRLGSPQAGGGLAGRVSIVERLGDSGLVYVELAATSKREKESGGPPAIVAKVAARRALSPGDEASVDFDPGSVHAFDAATGERLG